MKKEIFLRKVKKINQLFVFGAKKAKIDRYYRESEKGEIENY